MPEYPTLREIKTVAMPIGVWVSEGLPLTVRTTYVTPTDVREAKALTTTVTYTYTVTVKAP